jgi:hypothetical protein
MQLLEEEDDALDYTPDSDDISGSSSSSVVKAGAVGAAVKQLFGGTLVNYMEVRVLMLLNSNYQVWVVYKVDYCVSASWIFELHVMLQQH